jgi:hypothetical protein
MISVRFTRRVAVVATATVAVLLATLAQAHHSFPVHFHSEASLQVSGVVTEFRFTNPHGLVFFTVTDAQGNAAEWRAETNSPNVLRRRGWSADAIQPGDEITIHGYPSRDGSNFMRIYRVIHADGRELIGQRPSAGDDD